MDIQVLANDMEIQVLVKDMKGVIRIHKSKKDRQHNDKKKGQKDKQ
jgi:hypothetical protein